MNNSDTPDAGTSRAPGSGRLGMMYVLMLVISVGLFLGIRWFGESASDAALKTVTAPVEATRLVRVNALPHVLGALLAIIVLGRGLGAVFKYFGQPRVIGEVVAGILLGPSFLGRVAPDAMAFLLPPSVAPFLGMIAQLGVILYMFLVGLELNAEVLRSKAQATLAMSHASIVAPFLMGAGLALWLYPRLAPAGVPFTSFALFMGVAMSITAFPVLARILTDRGIERTELGVVALSCAAAGDVTAWCLLALVVGVAQSELSGALTTAVLTVGYIALMFGAVRPLLARWLGKIGAVGITPGMTVWVFVALLLSAMVTEAIGIHAIFGAFLLGAVIPHDSALAKAFWEKLDDVVTIPESVLATGGEFSLRPDLKQLALGWPLSASVLVRLATL